MQDNTVRRAAGLLIAVAAGGLSSCDGAGPSLGAPPTTYNEVIIETYQVIAGNPASNVDTVVTLFGAGGDTTTDLPDLWNATETGAIDENGGRSVYGKIDYTGGLTSGTYYIRVRSPLSTHSGSYAIRVLTAPAALDATWQFGATNDLDSPYEPDNTPLQGGVPTNPATLALGMGGQLNRWLDAGDVDWFKLVLP
jgi:hypothetical protein